MECGIGEGNTFAMFAYFIGSEDRAPKRMLYGFDSFLGWPKPSPYDVASPRNPQEGEWKVDEGMIMERFKDSKISEEFPDLKIKIEKGFLRDTLSKFPSTEIAFLHIDVDLYEGYRDALEYLFPMVVKSGIVALDEYKEFPNLSEYDYGKIEKWPGCTKAVDDFLKNYPEELQFHPDTKKYFLVKKADRKLKALL